MSRVEDISETHPVLLFDGVCNLCNGAVQFILKRDPKAVFRFASLQSETGQNLLAAYQLPIEVFDTLVLIDQKQAYTRSTAALRIARRMGGCWPLLAGLLIFPLPIRDAVYNWIARNRYRWFGKRESCMMPTPALKERFL